MSDEIERLEVVLQGNLQGLESAYDQARSMTVSVANDIQDRMSAAVADLTRHLQTQVLTYGMTTRQAAIYTAQLDLAAASNREAAAAALAEAQAYDVTLSAMEAQTRQQKIEIKQADEQARADFKRAVALNEYLDKLREENRLAHSFVSADARERSAAFDRVKELGGTTAQANEANALIATRQAREAANRAAEDSMALEEKERRQLQELTQAEARHASAIWDSVFAIKARANEVGLDKYEVMERRLASTPGITRDQLESGQKAIANLKAQESALEELLSEQKAQEAAAAKAKKDADEQAAAEKRHKEAIDKTIQSVHNKTDAVGKDKYQVAFQEMRRDPNATGAKLQEYAAALKGLKDTEENEAIRLKGLADAEKAKNDQMKRGADITAEVRTESEIYATRLAELNNLYHAGAINAQTFNRKLKEMNETTSGAILRKEEEIAVEGIRQALQERANQIINASKSGAQRYADAIRELNTLKQRGLLTDTQYTAGLQKANLEYRNSIMSIRHLGSQVRTIGHQMMMYVTTPIMAMGAASVYAFAQFDDAVTKSLAIMENVGPNTRKQMEAAALALSPDTITRPDELAKAYYTLASAGLNAQQAIGALAVVERFAVASSYDMEKSTELLAQTMSNLGKWTGVAAQDIRELTKTSDVLTKASNVSLAKQDELARSLVSKSGAAMRALNIDLEEGVAVLMAYAQAGIKGETAGEKFDIMLREIARSARKHADAWHAANLEIYDQNDNLKPLADIIEMLEKKFAGMSDREKEATFHMLGFRSESKNATQQLLGMSQKIREWEKELRRAKGETAEVADKQLKSFASQMKMTQNLVQVVAIDIGRLLVPALMRMNSTVRSGLTWFKSLDDTAKGWIITGAGVVASIGAIVTATGMAIIGFGLLRTSMVGLGMSTTATTAAMYGLRASMLAANAAVVLLGFGLGLEIGKAMRGNAGFKKFMGEMDAGTKKILNNAAAWEEWRGKVQGDALAAGDGEERAKVLEKALRVQDHMVKGAGKDLDGMQDQKKAFEAQFKNAPFNNFMAWFTDEDEQVGAKIQQKFDVAREAFKAAIEDQLRLRRDLANIKKNADGKPMTSAENEFQTEFEALRDEFEENIKAAGKTGTALKLYRLELALSEMKVGDLAKAEMQRQIAQLKDLEAQEKANKAKEKYVELLARIKDQTEITDDPMEDDIRRLERDGITPEQAQALRKQNELLKKKKKQLEVDEEAKEMMKKFQDPQKKFMEQQKKLDDMLKRGKITLQVYNKALKEAQDELQKDFTLTFKIEGVEGIQDGTAAALAAIRKHQATLKGISQVPGNGNQVVLPGGVTVPKGQGPQRGADGRLLEKPRGAINMGMANSPFDDPRQVAVQQVRDKNTAEEQLVRQTVLLEKIVANTQKMRDNPVVSLKPAGLGGNV